MPDLQAMRDDVALFAEGVLRRPLWPHQLEAAASDRFITSIAKARRTGGTTLVETLAAHACFRERNVKAVILSASQEASRRVTEDLGALLATSDVARGSVVDDFVTRIRLSNGSEIVSLPASQRAVRGLGRGVKLLVVDEAGFVPEELWRAAHYIALDERANGSRILLVGTPWGGPDRSSGGRSRRGATAIPTTPAITGPSRSTRTSTAPTSSASASACRRRSTPPRSSASGATPSAP
jgi:hypothetical protein